MMQAKPGAVLAARILTAVFFLVLLVMAVAAPAVTRWYAGLRHMPPGLETVILVCWYLCSIPAALALWRLWCLLGRIGRGQMFCQENAREISRVSWCALACAVICAVGTLYYAPFLLVTAAMLFLFCIVQVVALCFRSAAALAEENSLTI